MAACGDLDALRMLILEHGADVNLPMKDGTTPVHSAVEKSREGKNQVTLVVSDLLCHLAMCLLSVSVITT